VQPSPATTLSILDPTSLLGREVAEAITRMLPELRLRWFHTRPEPESLVVEIAGSAALVPPMADPEELAGSAAVLVTAPPAPAVVERLLGWLAENPCVALLDCCQSGVGREQARCVFDRLPASKPALPWYRLADPALAAPVRFVRALGPLEPRVLHLTAMCPVAALGEEALDELAHQAAARLSGQPVRKSGHLPAPLAFDLAPASSDRVTELEGQLGDLLAELERRVHVIDAGVFHGYLATMLVRCGSPIKEERVRALVRAAEGFRLTRRDEVPTTTRAVEHGTIITCGGIRVLEDWVSAWLLADGLALVGRSAALEIARLLSAC